VKLCSRTTEHVSLPNRTGRAMRHMRVYVAALSMAVVASGTPGQAADSRCIITSERQDYTSCNFRDANLSSRVFPHAQFSGAVFDGANLRGSFISARYGPDFGFPGTATMRNVNLEGATLDNGSYRGVDFSGASLRYASLVGDDTSMNGATLRGANLSFAFLKEAYGQVDVTDARLHRAHLDDTYLRFMGARADFSYSNIARSGFEGAQLPAASFRGARVFSSRFSGADLTGADFRDADLTSSRLAEATLTAAVWGNTICPDGTSTQHPDGDGWTCLANLVLPEG